MAASEVEVDRYAGMSADGRAALVAEMVAEYFHPGTGIPWWEMHKRPRPILAPRRARADDRPFAVREEAA